MKKSFGSFLTGITMTALLCSCNSSDSGSTSGTPTVTTGMTMTGSGQNAVAQTKIQRLFNFFIPTAVALTPPVLVDSSGTGITLSEAWVVVKEIEFEAEETARATEVDGNEIEFSGPFFVDLLSNAPTSFGDTAVPATNIRRIKMKLHESDTIPATAPVALTSKSIYFSGTVNGVAFSYAADDSTELEIAGPSPIVPSASQDMLAVIRTADLFKKLDLSSIVTPTDIHAGNRVNVVNPCPLIDASATDLYTCFRKGISTEANFGNDDGDLDLTVSDDTVE